MCLFFFFQAEDGIRDWSVTGVQTCALPISRRRLPSGLQARLRDRPHPGRTHGPHQRDRRRGRRPSGELQGVRRHRRVSRPARAGLGVLARFANRPYGFVGRRGSVGPAYVFFWSEGGSGNRVLPEPPSLLRAILSTTFTRSPMPLRLTRRVSL